MRLADAGISSEHAIMLAPTAGGAYGALTGSNTVFSSGTPNMLTSASAVSAATLSNAAYLSYGTISGSPELSIDAFTPAALQCSAVSHVVTATATPGLIAITPGMVTLTYAFNGGTPVNVAMTNSSGNTWVGTIPAATPANAQVTYSVTVNDGTYSIVKNGTTYFDAPLTGLSASASASASAICSGNAVTLTASLASTSNPTYTAPTQTGTSCVNSVSFNTLSSTPSACVSPFYSLIAATGNNTTTVTQGQSYNLTVNTDASSIVSVWIDYNRNGAFEASEWKQVYSSGITGTVSIDIPLSAKPGLTGMRIRTRTSGNANGSGDAQTSFGSGQTLDYQVSISPVYTYSWSDGSTTVGSTNPLTLNPTTTKSYTLTISDANGCSFSSNAVTVQAGEPLIPNGSASSPTTCAGASTILTAAPTGGGTPYTYSWKDASNNVISTSASLSVAPLSTTTYTLSVTDNCGTTQTQPVTVTVTQLPTASINEASPVAVCATTAALSSTTNAATPSYVWNFNGAPAGVTTANYTVNASGSYTVKVTDGTTGCSSTSAAVTVSLQIFPATVAVTPSSAATICLGQSQAITAAATFANSPVTILSEDFNGPSPTTFTITNGAGANTLLGAWTMRTSPYTYSTMLTNVTIDGSKFILANTDQAGSGSTTQARLTSNAFITVGMTSVTVSFKHFYRTFGSVTFAGVEYSTDGTNWSTVPNGAYNTTSSTGAASNPPTITSVSLSLPAAALNQASVRIRFRYDVAWDYYWGIDDVRITGTTTGSFAWASTTGAGIPNAATSAAATNNSIAVTPTAAGTYTYTVTASVAGNSCTNTATVTVNVVTPSTAPSVLNSSAASATCPGSNVILTQTGGSLGDGAHWQWYRDAAFTQAVGATTTAANAQITVAPSATTTYYLRAEGGAAPCASTVAAAGSVTVSVRAALTASIAAAQPVQCQTGLTATLNITGGPANGSVTVTTNGANPQVISLDGSGAAMFTSDPLNANATFTITLVSDGTCSTTISSSATVYVGVLIADPINNHSACDGTTVGPIPFTGNFPAGTQYSWTSTNPAVGLAQTSGTGTSLPSFTAVNTGTTDVYTDISVMPNVTSAAECKVRAMVFRITIRPVPTINGVGNQTLCAGTMTTPVTFSSPMSGVSYIWTNSNPAIGMAASGGGNLPAFIAQNSTASATISGTFTVTPHAVGCAGTPTTFTITVNRSVASLSYAGSPYCQGGTVNPILSGTRGGTFSSTVGLTIDGATGQVNLGQSQPGTYTITYTAPASGGACGGAVSTQITIKPQATVNNIGNQVYCNGMATAPIAFTGTATNYAWSNDNTSIGLAASGTGTSLPSFTTVNGGPATQYAYVAVMPLGNGTSTCNGRAFKFRIAVNFCPPITQAGGNTGGDATARTSSAVSLSPNPATGSVTVQYTGSESGPFSVQLLNSQGQPATRVQSFSGNSTTIDLSILRPGVYMLQLVNTRSGATVQKQLIKL
ncbi:MAG: T9SS type A sorting domain-containing protein [Chitinophagaceae bacterium]|nr:MAG: T9SS type A sorting domain-containing protein [Chitinophagaceae bacterium]